MCGHVTRFFQCKSCRTTFGTQHDPSGGDAPEGEAWSGPEEVRCLGCGWVTRSRALRPGRLLGARADWVPLKRFYEGFGVDFHDAVQFEGRRVIFGEVLSASGLDGARGIIMVSFDRDALYVHHGRGYEVPYDEVRWLEIIGRDGVLEAPSRDIVSTLVADVLATKEPWPSESVLAVAWEEGAFVVLNRSLRPEELANALEAVVARVNRGPGYQS